MSTVMGISPLAAIRVPGGGHEISPRTAEHNCRVVHANGETTLLVTLTCRHHRWDKAAELVPIMTSALGKVLSHRAWAGDTGKERVGL